jgi:hypothetical protein
MVIPINYVDRLELLMLSALPMRLAQTHKIDCNSNHQAQSRRTMNLAFTSLTAQEGKEVPLTTSSVVSATASSNDGNVLLKSLSDKSNRVNDTK